MRLLPLLVLCIVLFPLVTAQVTYYNDSLVTSYGGGESIRGNITVAFDSTQLDAPLRTNFGSTNVTLRSLLTAQGFNSGSAYNCSTANCMPGYSRKDPVTSISVTDGSALVGFSLQGTNVHAIQGTRFALDGSSSPSCSLGLGVDVLNNQQMVTSSDYTSDVCYDRRYGCFESSGVDYSSLILQSGTEYCERITLPVSPAFVLGATVTNRTQGTEGLKMRLRSSEGLLLSECTLPALSQTTQSISCTVSYGSARARDYFVCLMPNSPGSDYRMRAETHNPCGTTDGGASYPGDYEIYAQSLRFGSQHVDLSSSLFWNVTGLNLDNYIESYISDVYGGSCTPNCLVPFRLFGVDQTVQITNPYLRYTTSLGGSSEATTMYTIQLSNVTITSNKLVLDMSKANLTIPLGADDDYLDIYVGSERIVHKSISLAASFTFEVSPLFVAFGQNTLFSALGGNITSSTWSFGDGSAPQSSSNGTIMHRYLQQGTFTVEVQLTRADGATSRRAFNVVVGDAFSTANSTIIHARESLTRIKSTLSSYPTWVQEDITTQLHYAELDRSLQELESQFAYAVNDSEYATIASSLFSLNVPSAIRVAKKGTVPLLIGTDSLNVMPLQATSESDIEDTSALEQAVVAWMTANSDAQITFEQIVADFATGSEPVLTQVTIQTKPRVPFEEGTNLFINYAGDDLRFASESYNARTVEGATVIPLTSGDQTFSFTLLDAIEPSELGAYLSPSVSTLGDFAAQTDNTCNYDAKCDRGFGETHDNCPSDCRAWGRVVFLIILVVLAGAAAFAGIMWWYKTRYESSLFPNKQDLANVVSFIVTATRNNVPEKDIRAKLKKAGWTREQITYAYKKARMPAPRTPPAQRDTRFIKRPDFKAS